MQHRNQKLYDEISAYTEEIRSAARMRSLRLVTKIIGSSIIGIAILMIVLACHSRPTSSAIISIDEMTSQPAAMLFDASRKILEKPRSGNLYVVKVLVEPL